MIPPAASELRRAIIAGFGDFDTALQIEELASRDWSSITFSGARHRVRLRLEGAQAGPAADRFLADLPEPAWRLRNHLLADIALVADERDPAGACLTFDVLTVESS